MKPIYIFGRRRIRDLEKQNKELWSSLAMTQESRDEARKEADYNKKVNEILFEKCKEYDFEYMVEITNVKVYDLRESVIACRNAMRTEPAEYTDEEFEKSLERAVKLAKSPSNSGRANFLKGIRVSYDIKYPNYFSPELQRYGFNDIVSSSSKMHRLLKMDLDKACNKYVTRNSIRELKKYIDFYNYFLLCDESKFAEDTLVRFRNLEEFNIHTRQDALYYAFMFVLSNCPQGIELFMRCSTNYMQLRNIYHQRKTHRLREDWGAFCKFIEELPYFKEFINPE